ncbi:MAG: pilus assembly protein [Acidiferrobacter sp.]
MRTLVLCGLGYTVSLLPVTVSARILTAGQEPQILIILDNSQGMAGNLQGAIMSGSGTVAANAGPLAPTATPPLAWPSPVCYPIPSGYSPRSKVGQNVNTTASNGDTCPSGSAPYTVNAGSALQDNSESMINIAEQSLWSEFNNPSNSNAFQVGLMDYATAQAPSLYDTWVYYMSNNNTLDSNGNVTQYGAFGYGNTLSSPSTVDPVSAYNPCYGVTTGACRNIESVMGRNLANSQYLYIATTSDDPEINDVLYAPAGYPSNILTYLGPQPDPPNYTLTEYEDQIVNSAPLYEVYSRSTGGIRATAPTSAGYAPYSGEVWYGQRGKAYDAPPVTDANTAPTTNPYGGYTGVEQMGQGDLLVSVGSFSSVLSQFNTDLAPEEFPAGSSIVADSEYAPMAGTLQSALQYFTGTSGPQPACAPKYVILITDGQPTMGLHGHVYPPLGSAAASLYGEQQSNDNAVNEAITAVQKLYNNSSNGVGRIKTYVLGIGPNINCPPSAGPSCSAEARAGYNVLEQLATAGQGGTASNPVLPYSAQSPAQFQQAFAAILNSIEAQVYAANGGSSTSVGTNSFEYMVTSTPKLGEGDLLAYAIQANGSVATTPSWDIEGQLGTTTTTAQNGAQRSSALYSTGPAVAPATLGPITQLSAMNNNANASAFGTLPAGLTVSDIINYTINPSYNNDSYLGGRGAAWYWGMTASVPALYLGAPDSGGLLSDSSYVAYAQNEQGREPVVLFGDNDGFVYAADATTGALVWGWMPRIMLQDLQNYASFWQNSNMSGGVRVVDAKDANNNWHTYIVGVAGQGLVQYALQLTNAPSGTASGTTTAATLNSEAWEVDTSNATEPNPGITPTVFRSMPSSSTAYMATVLTVTSGSTVTSSMVVTDVGTGVSSSYTLPFSATTQPYIDPNGNMFVGDGSSNVWEASTFASGGGLSNFGSSRTWTALNDASSNASVAANFGTSATTSGGTSGLTSIGGVFYNGVEYLRLQSATRFTLLQEGSSGWQPAWTTMVSTNPSAGGDVWNATNGAYTADANIAGLPTGSAITASALVVNGAVMLPVTVPPSSTSSDPCAEPKAYLYLYQLGSGQFPSDTFQDAQGNFVTGPILVGYGTAYTPALALFDGTMRIQMASSLGDSPPSGTSGSGTGGTGGGGTPPPHKLTQPPPVFASGPPAEGPAGWRQLF